MEYKKNKLAIILLNWNGYKDTIECLESIFLQSNTDTKVIIVDNDSQDNSVFYINEWLINNCICSLQCDLDSAFSTEINEEKVIIIKSIKNLGFAKGNNIGIEFALNNEFEYIFLLNNDTILDKSCLNVMLNYMDNNRKVAISTGRIYIHGTNKIWNCGGKLTFFAGRKYYYAGKEDNYKIMKDKRITFITGCALLARSDVFSEYGKLTEKFFFGEEDFEFSLRMKKNNIEMICLKDAHIYHKVSVSSKKFFKDKELIGICTHYCMRFINVRDQYSALYYKVWSNIYFLYIYSLLKLKYKTDSKLIYMAINLIKEYVDQNNEVSLKDREKIKERVSQWYML